MVTTPRKDIIAALSALDRRVVVVRIIIDAKGHVHRRIYRGSFNKPREEKHPRIRR